MQFAWLCSSRLRREEYRLGGGRDIGSARKP
jgi:hypothetical protein